VRHPGPSTVEEPLPAASPRWAMDNVLITPHTQGETCRYEAVPEGF
jgi:D-2-hydroxyacid dehydrogenase (NADP+)